MAHSCVPYEWMEMCSGVSSLYSVGQLLECMQLCEGVPAKPLGVGSGPCSHSRSSRPISTGVGPTPTSSVCGDLFQQELGGCVIVGRA